MRTEVVDGIGVGDVGEFLSPTFFAAERNLTLDHPLPLWSIHLRPALSRPAGDCLLVNSTLGISSRRVKTWSCSCITTTRIPTSASPAPILDLSSACALYSGQISSHLHHATICSSYHVHTLVHIPSASLVVFPASPPLPISSPLSGPQSLD